MIRLLPFLPAALLFAAPEPTPSIRDAMKKLNRGPTSLTPSLQLELREDDPDWETIREMTAEYVKQTAGLAKQKPPRGAMANWETLARAYDADARALDDAARRRNRATANAALQRINRSCTGCHNAHKPE